MALHGVAAITAAVVADRGDDARHIAVQTRLPSSRCFCCLAPVPGSHATSFGPERPDRKPRSLQPASMAALSETQGQPFYPSFSAHVRTATCPPPYFLDSARCRDCRQENLRAMVRFRPPFRLAQQPVVPCRLRRFSGARREERAKWCAGCHDQALLFSGLMSLSVADLLDRPEAHVGVACIGCHGIADGEQHAWPRRLHAGVFRAARSFAGRRRGDPHGSGGRSAARRRKSIVVPS